MSGVSADSGTGLAAQADAELLAIYMGGDNFLARMKAMADAKTANEKALADLNLGTVTKQELDAAQAKHAQAAATLDAANTNAQAIMKEARDKATGIVADATAQAQASQQDINRRTAEFNGWLAKNKKDADNLMANAVKLNTAADDAHAKARATLADMDRASASLAAQTKAAADAQAVHESAAAKAESASQKYLAALAKLNAAASTFVEVP